MDNYISFFKKEFEMHLFFYVIIKILVPSTAILSFLKLESMPNVNSYLALKQHPEKCNRLYKF
jgi:hypothetical protein